MATPEGRDVVDAAINYLKSPEERILITIARPNLLLIRRKIHIQQEAARTAHVYLDSSIEIPEKLSDHPESISSEIIREMTRAIDLPTPTDLPSLPFSITASQLDFVNDVLVPHVTLKERADLLNKSVSSLKVIYPELDDTARMDMVTRNTIFQENILLDLNKA